MIWIRLLCLAVGYCFGAIQTAFFYGKLKGIDIREHGSGNAGTTNTLRVLGTKAGLIVFAGDMLKSIIAILLTRLIFKGIYPDSLPLLCLYTGAGCVLGHNFPFYMNFKGGKGIASTGGIMIAMHWLYVPVGLVVFFGTFFLTHYVSLGSLLLYLTFFVETVVLGELGIYGVTREILIEMYIIVFLLTVMAYWKHSGNISRLIHGNERKTYLSHKNQEKAKEDNK
ncbi:MAG: glycerol-3-phosphate 1-O-acyltransferase PlsY [Lachnospiraceae bacterium]|nr:glycerol-3-phosphate 1-O-acyltransferase PlsY [Lachnospiraceae bacterium]